MELAIRHICVLLSIFCFSLNISAQNQIPLHDALIDISKQHKLNLIFNPDQIENDRVDAPKSTWSVKKKLSYILDDSNLYFKIEDGQIFIFKKHKIYGYIEDSESGERLIAATILSKDEGKYSITNENGYFSFTTNQESLDIEVSYLGYATLHKIISENEMGKPITIGLKVDNNIKEIVISDGLLSNDERKYIELNKGSDILLFQHQTSSAIGGEPDIFQAMIRQSGVNAGPDGIGGIHIRGGRNDQNQILYDGVRLYNSAHAFGIYSIINSNIIDQAKLHKSGASGQYSGRLSSIMDVRIEDPNLKKASGNIQFSTIASQAKLEFPIIKDKVGVMISGRRSHIDPIVKSLSKTSKNRKEETGESNFYFDDLSLKLYSKISNRQRLYLSLYSASDSYVDDVSTEIEDYYYEESIFSSKEESDINWKNQIASLRYNLLLGSSTIANIQLSGYQYNFNNDNKYQSDDFFEFTPEYYKDVNNFTAGISTYDLRVDFQTNYGSHELKYGLVTGLKDYQSGMLTTGNEFATAPLPENIDLTETQLGDYKANESTAYITDKYRASNSVLLEGGLYLTHFESLDTLLGEDLTSQHTNIFGYLKSLFKVTDGVHLGASIGTYVQNEHILTIGDNGYPSDIWMPSTDSIPPERSYQVEVFSEIDKGNHKLKASGYIKKQNGVVVINDIGLPLISHIEADIWEETTFLADARGIGFELDYSYSVGDRYSFRSVYSAGYTDYYSDGEYIYPFEYSIPHTVNIALDLKLNKKLRLSMDWYFASGRPHTLYEVSKEYSPIERYENIPDIGAVSEFYNDAKLPPSHKLSASLSTYWYWGTIKNNLTLGVQNIYNRKNQLYTYYFYDGYDSTLRAQNSFPLMPLFKWRIEI